MKKLYVLLLLVSVTHLSSASNYSSISEDVNGNNPAFGSQPSAKGRSSVDAAPSSKPTHSAGEAIASDSKITNKSIEKKGTHPSAETITVSTNVKMFTGVKLYWIGNSGNWSDGNHWSLSSGGAPSGSIPTAADSVFFDLNSFTLLSQNVVVDDLAFFLSMDWTGIVGDQSLVLDTNMRGYGDITFAPNLTVVRGTSSAGITLFDQAQLTANASTIDCSFLVLMDPTDSLLIMDDLIMSDSSTLVLLNGEVYTQDNHLVMGTMKSLNNPMSGADQRKLDFGNSIIELKVSFDAKEDTVLVLNAGNSHLIIGDTMTYANDLLSLGLNFYDVTLNFSLVNRQQAVRGNNTFHNLTVAPGSVVYLQANVTQTVSDSLVLPGNCEERIYISSTDTSATAATAQLVKLNVTTNVLAENLVLQQINASGLPLTTLFSTDAGGNLNWVFDAAQPVTADYTFGGSLCFGDTVTFVNNSTAYVGGPSVISSIWYFNDGSTGYYLNPPVDSTFITYVADTNQHVFTDRGDFEVSLVTTNSLNQCTDTMTQIIHINRADVSLITSESDTTICSGDAVVFEASSFISGSTYEYFINGVSQNVPSSSNDIFTTTTLADQDIVSVLSYENGCVSDTMPAFQYVVLPLPVFNFFTSDADSSICFTDSVSFTAFQPSDSSYSYQFLINGVGVTSYVDSFNVYVNDSLMHNDTIFAVGLDVLGCYDTLTMIFEVNDLPTTALASSIVGNVICDGDLVTFTGTGADNYEFFVNGISVQGPSSADTYSTTTITASDTITLRGINSTGCEQFALETYNYVVSPIPATSLDFSDLDSTICSGDLVTFTASGAPIYEFFVNGVSSQLGTSDTYITDSLTNNAQVVVLGQIGACTSPSTMVTMEVLTSPTTTLTNTDNGDNIICFGTPITFTGTGATSYEFFIDSVSVQGPSALNTFTSSSLVNGQVVMLSGESNTCIVSEEDNFTVLNNPIVNFASNDLDNTICDGGSIGFVAANAGTYEFFVNGTSVQGPSSVTSLNNPSLAVGTNPILVVGTAGNGCTDTSAVINITVNPIPVVSVFSSDPDNTICAGEPVSFSASGSNFYQFFIGSTAQGALSTTSTFSPAGLTNGQSVSVLGSSLGCTSTSNAIITAVNPIPNVSIASTDVNNIYCSTELVNYTANGATNYQFFVNGISQGAPSTVNTLNSSAFPLGSFPLKVVGESNGCLDSTTTTVVINATPTAGISSSDFDNIICQGDVVTYTATGGSLYQFFINGLPQGSNSPVNTFTLNGLATSDVLSTTVSTAQGCSNSASMQPITVNQTPSIALTSSDPNASICVGESVTFTGSGGTSYEFFLNGNSQGAATSIATLSTSNLANGDDLYVVGTSLNCPATSNTISFTVYNYPVVSLVNVGDSELCVGEASNLLATGATNYQFLVNGSPVGASGSNNGYTTPLNNNDVVGVIGETNGCASPALDDFTFTVYTYPVLTSASSAGPTICLNDQVDFTASGALSYVYELNGMELQSGTLSTFGTNDLANGDIITVTGYNEECASASVDYVFTVNSMNLGIDVSPSTMICEGETVTITATGGDEYQFFINGASQGPLSVNNVFSWTYANLDEVTYTAFSNATSCLQDYSTFVLFNVIDEPQISALSNVEFCEGDSVVLTSNASYGNQWYLDGAIIPGATDTAYTAFTSGNYSLETTAGGIGSLWSFGLNSNGTFGDGTNFNNANPTQSISTVAFDEISTGENFAMGVTSSGNVYTWGENSDGQLGNGTYTSSNTPALLPTLSSIKTVATTAQSCMAVTNAGTVYVWGANADGQLSTGSTAVINFPFLNASLTNVDTIAAGKTHFVVLKADGTVWTVGNNAQGQLGHGNLTPLFSAVQVAGLSNIASVGAGEYSSYAIDNTGALLVWGSNGSGQLGLNDLNNRLIPVPSPISNAVAVQGGANHTVVQTTTNELYTFGGNDYGQLGTNDFLPRLVPEKIAVTGVQHISAGQYNTLVLRQDKSVFGFGNNAEGQLSVTSATEVNTPVHIAGLDGVAFVEAGKLTSHVIYNETTTCVSSEVNVNALSLPTIPINATGATLTTIAGVSYQWYFNGSIIPGAVNQSYVANETGEFSVAVTFANGCSGISEPFAMSFVSIDETAFIGLTVYPNPATSVLNLQFDTITSEEVIIQIFDQTGRRISSESRIILGTTQLDISSLAMGVYQLTLEVDHRVTNVRFVKSGE